MMCALHSYGRNCVDVTRSHAGLETFWYSSVTVHGVEAAKLDAVVETAA